MQKNIKALVVFSGGLDSILAVLMLREQNIKVEALSFESNFYNADTAKKTAEQLGINLNIINISEEIIKLTKNPPNGFGKNMNPCIDCHGLMFRLAGKEMVKKKFDILATGEVLGQRPFSQNKEALRRVQALVGVDVLRPLSARLLDETNYEKEGLVDREKLGKIQGRTRNEQMKLAKQYNIKDFPSPAGGCLLTDPGFSDRLRLMLENWPNCKANDIELLKNGRVFWFENLDKKKILLLVGRNETENENLEKLAQIGDIMLQLKDINGPLALVRGLEIVFNKELEIDVPEYLEIGKEVFGENRNILQKAAVVTAYYATKARGKMVLVEVSKV